MNLSKSNWINLPIEYSKILNIFTLKSNINTSHNKELLMVKKKKLAIIAYFKLFIFLIKKLTDL